MRLVTEKFSAHILLSNTYTINQIMSLSYKEHEGHMAIKLK